MPIAGDGHDAIGQLGLTVGESPVDHRIIEVDPEHAVLLGSRMRAQPILELAALAMHRRLLHEVAQATSMIRMKMTQGNHHDVARIDPDNGKGLLDRVPTSIGKLDPDVWCTAAQAPLKLRISLEGIVEPAVEQHPAAIDLEEQSRNGLAETDRRVCPMHRE